MAKTAVVALGGNALLRGSQRGTIEEQEQNTYDTMRNILFLLKEGYNLVISHGNGPQVGNILMRNDAGEEKYGIPQMPLDICVADSQGGIGYMLQKGLRNVLNEYGIDREIVSLITMVEVSENDPAFKNPTKRVGKTYYDKAVVDKMVEEKSWIFKEEVKDSKNGWRRVVPSPKPLDILNKRIVKELVESGVIVIASGGGGIPVAQKDGKLIPIEAVIDKDSASSLLARQIGADELYILTDVPYVYLNYAQPNQQILEFLDKADAERYLQEGKFGEGNMSPKIRASIEFVEYGGEKSVITESTKLEDKRYGTKITLNY